MCDNVGLIETQAEILEDACINDGSAYVYNQTFFDKAILNPTRVRTKGCDAVRSSTKTKNKPYGRKSQACGLYRG